MSIQQLSIAMTSRIFLIGLTLVLCAILWYAFSASSHIAGLFVDEVIFRDASGATSHFGLIRFTLDVINSLVGLAGFVVAIIGLRRR